MNKREFRIEWENKETGASGHGKWTTDSHRLKELEIFLNGKYPSIVHTVVERIKK